MRRGQFAADRPSLDLALLRRLASGFGRDASKNLALLLDSYS